ncbi:MAG: hypothetical protein ISP86_01270 [Shewanellaceae bacterium]|nr:hypothetical protein [Shewanellaceae bacterium]
MKQVLAWWLVLMWIGGCADESRAKSTLGQVALHGMLGTFISSNSTGNLSDSPVSSDSTQLTASNDANVIAVSAPYSQFQCDQTVVKFDPVPNALSGATCTHDSPNLRAGGVYVYHGDYKKAFYITNGESMEYAGFGTSIALSADGMLLAVGQPDNSTIKNPTTPCTGVISASDWNSDCNQQATAPAAGYRSGAVFMYKFDTGTDKWTLLQVIKPNAIEYYGFGYRVRFSASAQQLLVTSLNDDSPTEINSLVQASNITDYSTLIANNTLKANMDPSSHGAVYIYDIDSNGDWGFGSYRSDFSTTQMGSHVAESDDVFMVAGLYKIEGISGTNLTSEVATLTWPISALAMSSRLLLVGQPKESSTCIGVITNSTQIEKCDSDNSFSDSGGAKLFGWSKDDSNIVKLTLRALLKQNEPTVGAFFGEALTLAEDDTMMLSIHSDNGCVGVLHDLLGCIVQDVSTALDTGAVYQYEYLSPQAFIKTPIKKESTLLGQHGLYQFGNNHFIQVEKFSVCQGFKTKQELNGDFTCVSGSPFSAEHLTTQFLWYKK